MKNILTTLLIFSSLTMFAQNDMGDLHAVKVILDNGSEFSGTITEWQYGEDLTLKTEWNSTMVIPAEDIKKVKQSKLKYLCISEGDQTRLRPFNYPYNFSETGFYYAADVNLISSNQGTRGDNTIGMAFSLSAGKKYNRYFSLGGGIGYDNYFLHTGERIMPVFAESRGYFYEKNESLYYKLKLGAGFAFKDEDYQIVSASGGLMVHPSIGLRFGANKTKFTLDFGYKFQKANFVYDNTWRISDQKITYRRFVIGLGILL